MSNGEIQKDQYESSTEMQEQPEDQHAQQEQNEEQHDDSALPELKEYDQIEDKLKEIQGRVENEEMPLDESLDLYEQAVALGMQATKTIEQNVTSHLAKEDEEADVDETDNHDTAGNKTAANPKENAPSSKEIFGD